MTAPDMPARFEQPTPEDLRTAARIVDSDPVVSAYASCEWDCLHEDGQLWIAAIVREAMRIATPAALNASGAVQRAWDSIATLPAITFSPDEEAALLARLPVPVDDQIGYARAFYQLAALMGLSARPLSPSKVWEREMLPRLTQILQSEQRGGKVEREAKRLVDELQNAAETREFYRPRGSRMDPGKAYRQVCARLADARAALLSALTAAPRPAEQTEDA